MTETDGIVEIPEWLNSIKWKLVASIGIAAILIFSLVTGFTIMKTSGEVTSLTEDRMEETARAHANSLNTDMQETKQMATSLASTLEAFDRDGSSREDVSRMLENLAAENPDVLGVIGNGRSPLITTATTYRSIGIPSI